MRCRTRVGIAGACALILSLGACSSPLPQYPAMSPEDSLRTIADRLDSIRTFSAECEFVLTDASGETVHLDGAIAAEVPNRLRMRAWKLGHAAFDITIADGRVWVVMPEQEHTFPTSHLGEFASLLGSEYFRSASVIEARTTQRRLVVTGPGPNDTMIVCEIDRPTLTPRAFVADGEPSAAGSVTFDHYQLVEGTPWPYDITAVHPAGRFHITFHTPELNVELPANALTPPRRAILQP